MTYVSVAAREVGPIPKKHRFTKDLIKQKEQLQREHGFILPTLTDQLSAASPYPAINKRGSLEPLPLLSPSVLDPQLSVKAPFPPPDFAPLSHISANGQPRMQLYTQPEASTSKTVLPATNQDALALPFAIRPDVCIECLMRDRDMADVDVSRPGVWSRASDVDYYDALQAEEQDSTSEQEYASSLRKSGSWNAVGTISPHSQQGGNTSEESGYMGDVGSVERRTMRKKAKIGKGNALTSPSLKSWTSMNGSLSNHRWRTLHAYLNEQAHLMGLEQSAQQTVKKRQSTLPPHSPIRAASAPPTSFFRPRSRSSTVLPSGIVVEQIDVSYDERAARMRARQAEKRGRDQLSSLPYSPRNYNMSPATNSSNWSLQLPMHTQRQQERRFSDAGTRSNDMFSRRSFRSPSPGQVSMAWSERPQSTSFWSNSSRRSRIFGSANPSVSSFDASGSMIDMHLGMDIDKDKALLGGGLVSPLSGYPPVSENEASAVASKKKKKKGLKKLFSRLFDSVSAPATPLDQEVVYKNAGQYAWHNDEAYDMPLEPPYPSYFFDASQRHDRSASTSSQSSLPHSPRDGMPLSLQLALNTPRRDSLRDSLRVDSPSAYSSGQFSLQPLHIVTSQDSGSATSPISLSNNNASSRKEKNLPALPVGSSSDVDIDASVEQLFPLDTSSFAIVRPSTDSANQVLHSPGLDSGEEMIGGGSFSRAKAKSRFALPSLPEALKRPLRTSTNGPTPGLVASVPPPNILYGVARDDGEFTAFRYPSRQNQHS